MNQGKFVLNVRKCCRPGVHHWNNFSKSITTAKNILVAFSDHSSIWEEHSHYLMF